MDMELTYSDPLKFNLALKILFIAASLSITEKAIFSLSLANACNHYRRVFKI